MPARSGGRMGTRKGQRAGVLQPFTNPEVQKDSIEEADRTVRSARLVQ